MIPILYEKTETAFTTNGIGRLSDALSCIVTEERNGAYELAMEYVEGGMHAEDLDIDRIIFAKPSQLSTPQPFRIYQITKPLNQRFKVLARHISYDLAYVNVIPCGPYTTAAQALAGMATNSTGMGSFVIGAVTVSTTASMSISEPASFRNWIGGREGSLLDVFGGELEWDKFTVKLHANRGTNRGLTLRYGKNISDISKMNTNDYTVTGITPYYKDAAEKVLTLPEKSVFKTGASYSTPTRITTLDCQSMIDEQAIRDANPTETEAQIEARLINAMRTVAQAYADANLSGVPDASIEVSFVNLGDTEEYKDIAALFTQAALCDTVTVEYARLGISTTAKIVKTEYNVLLERFEKLTVGKTRATIGSKLLGISQTAAQATEASEKHTGDASARAEAAAIAASAEAIEENTALITGAEGGYVRFSLNADGKPYEILIMDDPDISQATKIWRWNIAGLGFSDNGYAGPYETALSMLGVFNTDFIAANTLSGLAIIAGTLDAGKIQTGVLDAALIKTGLLSDYAGKNSINMLTGQFSLCNGNFFYSLTDGDYIQLSNNLSLRLDGIPLAGRDVRENISISNDVISYLDPDISPAPYSIYDAIEMPYMAYFRAAVWVKTTIPDQTEIFKGLPKPAKGKPIWCTRTDWSGSAAVTSQQGLVYIQRGTSDGYINTDSNNTGNRLRGGYEYEFEVMYLK